MPSRGAGLERRETRLSPSAKVLPVPPKTLTQEPCVWLPTTANRQLTTNNRSRVSAVVVAQFAQALEVDGTSDKEDGYGGAGDGEETIDEKRHMDSARHR